MIGRKMSREPCPTPPGFNYSESNWCFKLSMCKVCNKDKKRPGIGVFNSITGFSDRDPTASSLQFSPTAFERF